MGQQRHATLILLGDVFLLNEQLSWLCTGVYLLVILGVKYVLTWEQWPEIGLFFQLHTLYTRLCIQQEYVSNIG